MKKKPLKKPSRVQSLAGPEGPTGGCCGDYPVTDKKCYSRPEVDQLIAEALPEPTPYDEMVRARYEFNGLTRQITDIEECLRRTLSARKECEKRLATLIAKVKSTADETQP